MLASLVIVFREAIEAGLIVGIVLAATRGCRTAAAGSATELPRARWALAWSPVSPANWARCSTAPARSCSTPPFLLIAVGMLTWHNAWMAGHGRELAREVRAIGAAVAEGDRPLTALAVVVGVAVLREGSEVVLFLYGIFASRRHHRSAPCWPAVQPASLLGAVMSALIYLGLLAVPAHRLFAVTTGLIMLLAAGLAAQAVFFLQQADYFQGIATPLWDTSWLLSDDSIPGRLMHTLIGYTATPDGAQLLAYAAGDRIDAGVDAGRPRPDDAFPTSRCVRLPEPCYTAGGGTIMKLARAAVLRQTATPMTIETVQVGPVAPGDVLVRMRAASLCHTDLEAIEGALAVKLPAVLGHEAAGEIAGLGDGVTDLAVGDRVVLSWNPHCGRCFYCDRAQPILCSQFLANGPKAFHFDGKTAAGVRWRADAPADVSRRVRRILRGAGAERDPRAGGDAVRSRGTARLRRDDRRRRRDPHRRTCAGARRRW